MKASYPLQTGYLVENIVPKGFEVSETKPEIISFDHSWTLAETLSSGLNSHIWPESEKALRRAQISERLYLVSTS